MVIEYLTAGGVVLDRLVIDEDGTVTEATTGKGRDQVATFVRQFGPQRAAEILRDWSNGYVLTREVAPE